MIWIEFKYILFLLFRPRFLGALKRERRPLPRRATAFREGHKKSSPKFQKISWEETEKQTAGSLRAWEFSRSRAQGKRGEKEKMYRAKAILEREAFLRRYEGAAGIESIPFCCGSWLNVDSRTFGNDWEVKKMVIGDRLRALREEKSLSQGDIEKRTGLLRCYISRVENGHTVPAIETLEKMARALEVPLYQLFYDGEEPPKLPNLLKRKTTDDIVWGSSGKEARLLSKLQRLLGRLEENDRKLLMSLAQKMAQRSNGRKSVAA